MLKFLQWGLVTIVAIVLLAAVVGQILATSTGRAREASVAVLKEKLARLKGRRPAPDPVTVSQPSDRRLEEISLARAVVPDGSDLRSRWLALFDELAQTWGKCGFEPPFPERVLFAELYGVGEDKLDAAERQALSDYRACVAPTLDALTLLLQESGELHNLINFSLPSERSEYDEELWFCERLLSMCFWIDATLADHSGIVEAYAGSVRLTDLTRGGAPAWAFEPTLIWGILEGALPAETVDPTRWDRLLVDLKSHRDQECFLEQIRRGTEQVLFAFENWKSNDWGFGFSDSPIGYMRTWAYPRLTPALFNHDFDRFNRAMAILLELANKPYFEVKDDLEQFYIDFDVEPDLQSMKFTRSNPGWRYVLSLSRHGFEQNARNQASIDVIRCAILLEKHRRDSGSYPESLEVFAEALGGSLPVNPLTGDAYVYMRTEDSFRLGFSQDTHPDLVAVGLELTTVTWWHDPLGVELEENFE